jgi:hypothetical protein
MTHPVNKQSQTNILICAILECGCDLEEEHFYALNNIQQETCFVTYKKIEAKIISKL